MSDAPKITPYDGDPCACVNCADEDATMLYRGEAVCLTCCQACEINAQAAELARLRAKVAAADKLAEAGGAMIAFHNGPAEAKRPDMWQRMLQRFASALTDYRSAGE